MLTPRLKCLLMLCGSLFLTVLWMVGVSCAQSEVKISGVTAKTPNHDGAHVAANIVDGDSTTAWIGGGSGIGPGKSVELTLPQAMQLTTLSIANGNQAPGEFDQYRCVTQGFILYPDKARQMFTLKAESGEQRITLLSKTADFLRIIITGVTPGAEDTVVGKVALSEITVFGVFTEPAAEESVKQDTDSAKAVEPAVDNGVPGSEKSHEPDSKSVIQSATVVQPVDAVSVVVLGPVMDEGKTKAVAKKVSSGPSASMIGITRLRSAALIPADKPLKAGVLSPWLDLAFVTQVRRYFSFLTTLHDSYPDIFATSIRARERKIFLALQELMREKNEFAQQQTAMVEHEGLSFDKPIIRGDSAVVHVSGPYRYSFADTTYEFVVNTTFSFQKEHGHWLINGVLDN